ncbi:tRNA-dependent cyclodipeptide synthase [Sodalis sp. RH21]|uniref:tRNA-dependent cyclodipeptide synthase n=1 Tax=unclassified Sodalis (in: enterobacteria) TaxID=2636512 RepID=UPI0039B4FE80
MATIETVTSPKRFRAKTAFVFPERKRVLLEKEERCFLGVSLENKNFQAERIGAMLKWISARFNQCELLIGDSIHRITLQTQMDIASEDAINMAIDLGQQFIERTKEILSQYECNTNFSFVTCHQLQSCTQYHEYYEKLCSYHSINSAFRKSVEEFSVRYHKKDWGVLSEEDKKRKLNMSTQYFLEEFAIFACMVKNGSNIMIYPGTFSSLAEIADGKFPGVLYELENLTVVSLNVKRR